MHGAKPLRHLPGTNVTLSTLTKNGARYHAVPALGHDAQPQAPIASSSSNNDHRTLRPRAHGNRQLPLPPLLDPIAIAAKERCTTKKALPDEDLPTPLQKQLAANPFAHALATPIRQCHHTKLRLPSHFLQPFSAAFSPPDSNTENANEKTTTRPMKTSFVPQLASTLPRGTGLPSSTYVLARYSTIEGLSAGRRKPWARLADQRMQDSWAKRVGKKRGRGVDVGREWGWDGEMACIVLRKLQEEVVAQFEALLVDEPRPERMTEEASDGNPYTLHKPVVGDIASELFHFEGSPPTLIQLAADPEVRRECFPGVDWSESLDKLGGADYVLSDLLAPEQRAGVRDSFGEPPHRRSLYVVVRACAETVKLRMALHKLAVYQGKRASPKGGRKWRK